MHSTPSSLSRRSLSILAGIIGASVAFHGSPALAQQSEIDQLRQQLAEIQARLDKLEAAKVDVKAITPTVSSASKTPIVVSALLQVQTNDQFNQDTTAGNRQGDSLRLRRGEIRITAPAITPRLSGTIMLDPAKTLSQRTVTTLAPNPAVPGTFIATSTTTNNQSTNPLQEIVLSYQVRTDPKTSTFVDLGQYKIPVGYEGDLVSSGALQTIERSLFYREADNIGALNPTNANQAGGFGDKREKGVRLRGSLGPEFDYQVGLFSGLGERQNTASDITDQKIPIARIVYKPASVQGLQLGLSGAKGNESFTGTKTERHIYNGFIVFKKDKITAQTEYMQGKGTIDVTPETFKDTKSYYGSLGYLFTPKLELVGRYDSLRRNFQLGALDNRTTETTLGLNYYLKGNNAKAQLDVVKVDNSPSTATFYSTYVLRSQFQVAF